MAICQVKNINISEGKPKICLPIVEIDDEGILNCASSFQELTYDLVELRIDFYKDVLCPDKVISLLKQLREILTCPLIFTYRSLKEGGQIQLTDEQYFDLINHVCKSGYVDIVDIELMSGNQLVFKLVDIAHKNNVKVIMSNHDFHKTPDMVEMKDRLEKMEVLGADILKIAVMPQSKKDVITVLDLTMDMSQRLDKPIVTMSMGELGKISRIVGELTGSAITFASSYKSSAPGQIEVSKMNMLLEAIHD